MIGTLLHFDSLLQEKITTYKGKVYKACDENFDNIMWPERFSKKKLLEIKKDIGSIPFQQEYLNNPLDTTDSIIKREWVQASFRPDLSQEEARAMEFKFKLGGGDFAFSDRITSDETSFVTIGTKDDYFYLLDCRWYKGLSLSEQMNILKNDIFKLFRHDVIGLEENSIKSISKDISQYNMPIRLFWTGSQDPPAPQKDNSYKEWEAKRHTVGKINLINRMSVAFENGRVIIPYKTENDKILADRLMSELTSWALNGGKLVEAGVHPDAPIALAYSIECAQTTSSIVFG